MRANDYQEQTRRTDAEDYAPIAKRVGHLPKLVHYGLGMVTESAEFCDALKKHMAYGRDLDPVNLKEELGDLLWYVARACTALGTTMEEVMSVNHAKLAKRFPEKFSEEKAIIRDLDAERKILEG